MSRRDIDLDDKLPDIFMGEGDYGGSDDDSWIDFDELGVTKLKPPKRHTGRHHKSV